MSIVLPGKKKTDFLAPSKALQDAKEVLGPVYFDAKLIECPQNAVELSKLIKEWDEIDKQKFKAAEEVRRNQRVLLHTLSSRYTFSKSSVSLDALSDVRDVKLPPPGFRFHADGSKKLVLGNGSSHKMRNLLNPELYTVLNDEEDDFIVSKTYINHHDAIPSSLYSDSKVSRRVEDDLNASDSFSSRTGDTINEFELEKKSIERLKKEIEEVLSASDLGYRLGKSPQNYLRAHSSKQVVFQPTTEILTEKNRPNDRFAIKPGSSTFTKSESKVQSLHKPTLKYPICSKCSACRYKLQHNDVEFRKLQENLNNPKFRRWNIAPRGKLVECPKLSPRMSTKSSSFIRGSSGDARAKSIPDMTTSPRCRPKTAKFREEKTSHNSKTTVRKAASACQRQPSDIQSTATRLQSPSTRAVSAYSMTRSPSSGSSISFWKSVAIEEGAECEEKVKDFLRRLKEEDDKPRMKLAFQ